MNYRSFRVGLLLLSRAGVYVGHMSLGGSLLSKVILTIILICIGFNLSGLTIGTDFLIRTPNDDANALDYKIGVMGHIDSLVLLEVEFERIDNIRYNATELFLWQYYKFIQVSGKYINISRYNLHIIGFDIRFKHGTHSIGLSEMWDLHPEMMLVVGEDIKVDGGIPYLIPINFRAISNVYTNDFRKFNSEIEVVFSMSASSVIDIYLRFKQRFYDHWDFSTKIGISIKL